MVIDAKLKALDEICISSKSTTLGTFVGTLKKNLDDGNAYAGDLLTNAQIAKLNGMCVVAKTTALGTVLNGLLTASKTAVVVTKISNAFAASLNKMCGGAQVAALGTTLQACADKINLDASSILTFAIATQTGSSTINRTNKTVALTMPFGTDPAALVATFTLSAGAGAKVGLTAQVSGVTANDFTTPVTYSITALGGTVITPWVVTVTIAAS